MPEPDGEIVHAGISEEYGGMNMKARMKVAVIGTAVLGASVLLSPLFETISPGLKARPARMAERETSVINKPRSESGTIRPLLRKLQDKNYVIRMSSVRELQRHAENGNQELTNSMPAITEALEKESEKKVKDELRHLRKSIRHGHEGAFY